MVRIKRQWRLRPFLFSILVLFNASFLILITVSIYVSVSYYFTKQISETRMEMLLNRHQQLQEKIAQIEETALSISTDRNLREALNSTHLNVIDSIMVRRQLNMWLDNFIYIKPYINSIQLYTDRFVDDIAVGGNRRILPLSAIPWTEELDRFNEVDAIWIPANLDTHSEYGETPVLTYVLKISDRGRNTSAYVAVNLAERALAQFLLKESDDHRGAGYVPPGGRAQPGRSRHDGCELGENGHHHVRCVSGRPAATHFPIGRRSRFSENNGSRCRFFHDLHRTVAGGMAACRMGCQ